MGITLYELDYNLRQLDALLSESQDEETLEILEETKKVLLPQIEERASDILTYISDCTSRAKHLKEEAARITKKSKSLEKRADFLKGIIKQHMVDTKQKNATYGIYDVTLAKTPDRVVLADDATALLPDHLCTVTRTPSKEAIKALMKDGKFTVTIDGHEVELAHLESNETIRIN